MTWEPRLTDPPLYLASATSSPEVRADESNGHQVHGGSVWTGSMHARFCGKGRGSRRAKDHPHRAGGPRVRGALRALPGQLVHRLPATWTERDVDGVSPQAGHQGAAV